MVDKLQALSFWMARTGQIWALFNLPEFVTYIETNFNHLSRSFLFSLWGTWWEIWWKNCLASGLMSRCLSVVYLRHQEPSKVIFVLLGIEHITCPMWSVLFLRQRVCGLGYVRTDVSQAPGAHSVRSFATAVPCVCFGFSVSCWKCLGTPILLLLPSTCERWLWLWVISALWELCGCLPSVWV